MIITQTRPVAVWPVGAVCCLRAVRVSPSVWRSVCAYRSYSHSHDSRLVYIRLRPSAGILGVLWGEAFLLLYYSVQTLNTEINISPYPLSIFMECHLEE
jgi:hypothetical protein